MGEIECRVAICDDEIRIGRLLKKKLLEFSMRHNVEYKVTLFQDGRHLLDSLKAGEQFDLIFLDVQMPGINGIDTAAEIRRSSRDVILVFLSSYKEYVFETFKVQAFRYLLKPLKDEDFEEVMESVYSQWARDDRLEYSFQNEYYSVSFNDILYIDGMRGKIWIHTADQVYRWRGALSLIAEDLRDREFFLIHRSYLINMKKIVQYNSQQVILENGEKLPISKHRYNEFRKEYIRLWGELFSFRA